MWEAETGKLVQTTHAHRGWVTDFLFWLVGKHAGNICDLSAQNLSQVSRHTWKKIAFYLKM